MADTQARPEPIVVEQGLYVSQASVDAALPPDILFDRMERAQCLSKMIDSMDVPSNRYKVALFLYYGIGGGRRHTQREIGKLLRVSSGRAHQMIRKSERALRAARVLNRHGRHDEPIFVNPMDEFVFSSQEG
jgi:DNA-directed RNA polymerase specialized sigma subunit